MPTRINRACMVGRTCGGTRYNAARPMSWNMNLFQAAANHFSDMAANGYFSHTGLDGSRFSDRLTAAGY